MKSYAIANIEGPGMPDDAFVERVSRLSSLDVDYIQLRAKALDASALYDLALRCRDVVESPCRFLVNGRLDVAIAAGADGVHLPSRGLRPVDVRALAADMTVGVSCHTLEDCRVAAGCGVDYLLLGPLYSTRSKTSEGRISVGELREAAGLSIQVFALGGITIDRLGEIAATGADGVAAVTMFMNDEPIAEIVERVRRT